MAMRIPCHAVACPNCYKAGVPLNQLLCGGCNKCKKMNESWQHFQDKVDDVIPLSQKAEETVHRMTTRAMAGQGNSERSLDQRPWIGRYSHQEMARMQKEDLDFFSSI